jgi:hypothetical protein
MTCPIAASLLREKGATPFRGLCDGGRIWGKKKRKKRVRKEGMDGERKAWREGCNP